MNVVLEIQELTTSLKIEGEIYPVVESLSFSLEEGKTLALVGESGCGKSMTALSILRILPEPPALPPQGKILYRGEDLLGLSEKQMRQIRGARIAVIFQDPMSALNPVYTIGQQLVEVLLAHTKLTPKQAEARVLEALADVQLPSPKNRMEEYPHQMSGGMLQRAMIAMALLCNPDVLIADEPTTALDVTIQAQILSLLKELQAKRGMATLLITHDMSVVAEMADEVIVMYAGQQIEKGNIETLFDNPCHPYTQALFASRPETHARQLGRLPVIEGSVPRITDFPEGCRFHPRCKYALPLCQTGAVPQFPLKERGHQTRCWLYDRELAWKIDATESEES